jgi:hypothetical protein
MLANRRELALEPVLDGRYEEAQAQGGETPVPDLTFRRHQPQGSWIALGDQSSASRSACK